MIWLYVIIAFIIISLIIHFSVIYLIFLKFFGRNSLKSIDKSSRKTSYSKAYAEEMISIRNELTNSSKYEIVSITSFDGLKLTGYYFANNSDKTIIMCHGLHTHAFNNFGYQIKYFLAKGYNILAINERAHEGSEGKYATYGQKESKDILSWLDYVSPDEKINSIYLYGISMGATALAYASEKIINKKVKLLIFESMFSSVNELTTHIMTSQHVPSFFFAGAVRWLSKCLAGISWDNVSTTLSLQKNHIPSVFVHASKDSIAINKFFEDNYNNCLSNKYKIIVDGAAHALCALHDKDKYLDQLESIIGEQNE